MAVALSKIIEAMERLAPARLALEGDNIGLQTQCSPRVGKALVTLDVDTRVVAEAKRRGADLIIAHHPVIYHKLDRIAGDSFAERVVIAAIRSEIGIFVAHTNLDCAPGGVNDVLAHRMVLQDIRPLKTSHEEKYHKVTVFVPEDHADKVRAAMCRADAGQIGDYSFCSFQAPGTGTFVPSDKAKPFAGAVGELNKEPELRLEVLAPESLSPGVVAAMKIAHPYEEVAYDIYELVNPGVRHGLGRIGDLPDAVGFKDYVELVRRRLGIKKVRIVGRPRKKVRRVAVCGGSGGSLVPDALAEGADAFVAGEVGYHEMMAADALGLCVVEAGHGATERIALPALAQNLQRMLPDLKIIFTRIKTDRSEWV